MKTISEREKRSKALKEEQRRVKDGLASSSRYNAVSRIF